MAYVRIAGGCRKISCTIGLESVLNVKGSLRSRDDDRGEDVRCFEGMRVAAYACLDAFIIGRATVFGKQKTTPRRRLLRPAQKYESKVETKAQHERESSANGAYYVMQVHSGRVTVTTPNFNLRICPLPNIICMECLDRAWEIPPSRQ